MYFDFHLIYGATLYRTFSVALVRREFFLLGHTLPFNSHNIVSFKVAHSYCADVLV